MASRGTGGRRGARKAVNPLGTLVVAAIVVTGGVVLYFSGPQVGPYLPPPRPAAATSSGSATGGSATAPLERSAVVPKALSFLIDVPGGGGLELEIRGGPQAVTIAAVELDGVATAFTIEPNGPIAPGANARVTLSRNLDIGEIRKVTLVAADGQTFTRELERLGSALYSTRFGGAASDSPPPPAQP